MTEWLTATEAAEELRLSRWAIYRLVRDGLLPAYRFRRGLRIDPAALERFKAGARVKPRRRVERDRGTDVFEIARRAIR
jgi:excisionase family DNA binding protein